MSKPTPIFFGKLGGASDYLGGDLSACGHKSLLLQALPTESRAFLKAADEETRPPRHETGMAAATCNEAMITWTSGDAEGTLAVPIKTRSRLESLSIRNHQGEDLRFF